MNRQYVSDSVLLVVTRISSIILGLATGIITARMLGPSGRGALAVVGQIASLTIALGHLGVGDANLYHLTRGDHPLGRLRDHSVGFGLALGSLYAAVVLAVFTLWHPAFLADISVWAMALSVASVPFALTQKYLLWLILGIRKTHLRWVVTVVEGTLRFALILALALWGVMSVESILVATLVVAVVTAATAALFTGTTRQEPIRPAVDPGLIRASVGFGLMPYLVLMVVNLLLRIDVLLVKYFLPTAQVGVYAVGTSIAERLWILPEALSMALYAQALREQRASDKNSMTPRVVRVSLFGATAGSLALMAAAPLIIPMLYGQAFAPATAPFCALLPGVICMTVHALLHSDLTARGKASITLRAFSIGLVVNVLLNLWLIPAWGIVGAAVASSLAYGLGTVLQVIGYCRLTGTRPSDLLVIKAADVRGLLRFVARRSGPQVAAP